MGRRRLLLRSVLLVAAVVAAHALLFADFSLSRLYRPPALGLADGVTVLTTLLTPKAAKPTPEAPKPAAADATAPETPAAPIDHPAERAAERAPETKVDNAAAPAGVAAFVLPPSAQLYYAPTAGGPVTATLNWQTDGQRYSLQLNDRATGALISSRGLLDRFGLAPERYQATSAAAESGLAALAFGKFGAGAVLSRATGSLGLVDGAQDPLSAIVELAGLIAGAPDKFAPGNPQPIYVANSEAGATWQYGCVDELLGATAVKHCTRQSPVRGDGLAEVWIAPTPGSLPLRLRFALGARTLDLLRAP